MPLAILLLLGLVLLAFWISIPLAIYVVPALEQQWPAGYALNTLETLMVISAPMIRVYWWLLLPLLVLGTAFWAYVFYRVVLRPEDLPDERS